MGRKREIVSQEEKAEPVQTRRRRHIHKKHKKKKSPVEEVDSDTSIEVSLEEDTNSKPAVRLKNKSKGSPVPECSKAQIVKNVEKKVTPTVMATSPKTTAPGRKKKGTKGKESGTSSEEERWLDAIESGKLEEVDDELKKIKPKDPKMMTARQRAMYERGTDKEPSPGGEVLLALPSGYKEKVMTAEAIQKAAIKSQKRKQLADEKREKDKKKTMERLLKKQDSKVVKGNAKSKTAKKLVPLISYRNTADSITLSMPPEVDFPLAPKAPIDPPKPVICAVEDCVNLKKYSCSQTGVPLCSLECYKKNLFNVI